MLKSIEFHGSKTKSVGGLQGASLEEPEAVHQVCNETALAVLTCNKILEEHKLRTFGLLVAGHTSGKWVQPEDFDITKLVYRQSAPGYDISVNRAKVVCNILNAEMSKVSPTSGLQEKVHQLAKVEYKGYGCAQPLEGFDDGENHEENRRVEFKLIREERNT